MRKTAQLLKPLLNAYAVLFFSQNSVFGALLLIVTFFNITAGLCGLAGVLSSLLLANALGFDRYTARTGIYSFNNLLLGLAFGTFFHINAYFFLWYAVASLIAVVIAGILTQRLGKIGLPILSLPFILTFWIVMLAANSIFNTGLLRHHSPLLQEIFSGQNTLLGWHAYLCGSIPPFLCLYFRALSAILFQDNVITGIVVTVGLIIHSRISFTLSFIGFAGAMLFNSAFHIYPDGISYYHLGANFVMATIAIGSFFLIPSWRSYLSALLCIPVLFILINASSSLLGLHFLPVFSLPFCIVNFTLLYFLLMRKGNGGLHLAPIQHYSPERNLYQFANQSIRLDNLKYINLSLPFMGNWTVSQGYEGKITHQGDWGQALDFVITDDEGKTYKYPGTQTSDFYCYNKPVLACGDGTIETIINNVNDNAIGEINTLQNWGNTVVIKHLDGLYSKVSHLKKGSVKVIAGQYVKTGDMLGFCGNSGRSPEPHLHFQVQTTPYVGSKTLAYPFAAYEVQDNREAILKQYVIPVEGQTISPQATNMAIKKAFGFQPGYVAKLKSGEVYETLEVFKDELNQSYLYSQQTGAAAYFIVSNNCFYFTSFYGDRSSLLYQFYQAAFNVSFSENIIVTDVFPAQDSIHKTGLLIQDLIAPFYRFTHPGYKSRAASIGNSIKISAHKSENKTAVMNAEIYISGGRIERFENTTGKIKTNVEWIKDC